MIEIEVASTRVMTELFLPLGALRKKIRSVEADGRNKRLE